MIVLEFLRAQPLVLYYCTVLYLSWAASGYLPELAFVLIEFQVARSPSACIRSLIQCKSKLKYENECVEFLKFGKS